jgi:hypothetical protein
VPGDVDILATSGKPGHSTVLIGPGKGRAVFGRGHAYSAVRGRVIVHVWPTKTGKALMGLHRKNHRVLHLFIYTTFTPTGGKQSTKMKVLTIGRDERHRRKP